MHHQRANYIYHLLARLSYARLPSVLLPTMAQATILAMMAKLVANNQNCLLEQEVVSSILNYQNIFHIQPYRFVHLFFD